MAEEYLKFKDKITVALAEAKAALLAAGKIDDSFQFSGNVMDEGLFFCDDEKLVFQVQCEKCQVEKGMTDSDWCPLPAPMPTPTAESETEPDATTAPDPAVDNEN